MLLPLLSSYALLLDPPLSRQLSLLERVNALAAPLLVRTDQAPPSRELPRLAQIRGGLLTHGRLDQPGERERRNPQCYTHIYIIYTGYTRMVRRSTIMRRIAPGLCTNNAGFRVRHIEKHEMLFLL